MTPEDIKKGLWSSRRRDAVTAGWIILACLSMFGLAAVLWVWFG